MIFHDRQEAGRLLAERLGTMSLMAPIHVLALPRGGVPVAREVADRLGATLDLLVVRKIGAPWQPELAIGAVAEDGRPVWSTEALKWCRLDERELKALASQAAGELAAKARKWAGYRKKIDISGSTVIVVDDGLATGATMAAALQLLRRRNPRRLIMAVPVASSSVRELASLADDLIVLHQPESFRAVGQWYEDFSQVSDEEVARILAGRAAGEIKIPCGDRILSGVMGVPERPRGLIIFVHGSGSSHRSPRNQRVARSLNDRGFATLLFDLMHETEAEDRRNVFDIALLAARLRVATQWARQQARLKGLPIGYFGASTGAAAALRAAALDKRVRSVVSRGGRPDLATGFLGEVKVPVLLIVGGNDNEVLALNELAAEGLARCEVSVIPGAAHLFEESGAMDEVTRLAGDWFEATLAPNGVSRSPSVSRAAGK